MSQSFTTALYTTGAFDAAQVLPTLAKLIFGEAKITASRWAEPDRSWACIEGARSRPELEEDFLPEYDFENRGVRAEEVAALYDPKLRLKVTTYAGTALGDQIWRAVHRHISPAVRGQHAPSGPALIAGEHDLWSDLENPDGVFFARATLSLEFSSYNIPPDPAGFVQRFVALGAMRELRAQVEALVGPLHVCTSGSA